MSDAVENVETRPAWDTHARPVGRLRKLGENLHFGVSVLLGVALIPTLMALKLPVRFDWPEFFQSFWVGLAVQSFFYAALLCVIGLPWRQTLQPLWRRYWDQKRRLLFLAPVVVELFWLLGPTLGLVCCVAMVALVEVLERARERGVLFSRTSWAVVAPAGYLFAALILVTVYNDVVVSLRFYGAYDGAFNRMDAWLLAGRTVPDIAHWALRHLPARALRFFEFVYFGMFPQVGAGIIFTGMAYGRKRAVQFVGTLVTAYYLSLLLFVFWPSQGPYYLCATHFTEYPRTLGTCLVQQRLLQNVQLFWQHRMNGRFGLDYFIAFPSMHMALISIVLWYLRRWKRVVAFLVVMDLLILASTLLFEWHYAVDLIGGVVVASLAIGTVGCAGQVGFRAGTRFPLPSLAALNQPRFTTPRNPPHCDGHYPRVIHGFDAETGT